MSEEDLPSPEELLQYAEDLLLRWQAHDLLDRIEIRWNRRMRTRAGVAYLISRRIELNPRLLAQNPEMVHQCFAHELAHIVIYARFGQKARAHGKEWRALMREIDLEPLVVHQMDVSQFRRPKRSSSKKPRLVKPRLVKKGRLRA
jgi:predicted SprT family Zn-dependent metalloprotease